MSKALFLDRDGVINVDHPYVHTREQFHFLDGIFELCRAARRLDYLLFVVTNQAGIGRGYYSENDFFELTRWMTAQFGEQGIAITRVYHCPYHPLHGIREYKQESPDRKPNPGMFLRAQAEFGVDLEKSLMIGNNKSDMDAARAAGVGTKIFLQSAADPLESVDSDVRVLTTLDAIRQSFFAEA